jgi:CheY-like chemotaxis protein
MQSWAGDGAGSNQQGRKNVADHSQRESVRPGFDGSHAYLFRAGEATFPSNTAKTSNGTTSTANNGSHRPILVVDDDAVIRDILVGLLEDEGYLVLEAANGRSALDLTARRPGLILLDLQMPIMDGWTFLTRLSEEGAPAPVVTMSAAHGRGRGTNEPPVVAHLAKPFDLDDVLALVRRFYRAE